MRYFLNTLITLFLLVSLAAEAQTDIKIRRNEFKAGSEGFNEAWKQVDEGDSYFVAGGVWYSNAFDAYLKAYSYNGNNAELNYKLGASALLCDRKADASDFLLKSYEIKNDVSDDILFLTGKALIYSGNFETAAEKLNAYLSAQFRKPAENIIIAKKLIEECKSAIVITRDTLRVEITNPGPSINSVADEYSEVISTDGNTMYFASRREMPKAKNHYSDSKFDENIFVTQFYNGTWGAAASPGKDLTTPYCETPLYIDTAGTKLFIYAGYSNGGDIMVSEMKKGKWRTPGNVKFNINSRGSETSFAITPSGNEIYFVSDNGKGKFGGKDIYYIKKLSEKKWSKKQNAGSLINSEYDEESVRFSRTGDTLWFSSKGHNTMGGFDIFYTVRNNTGSWDSVRNCGYPINTVWDEIFYQPSFTDDSLFYFTSNRSGGLGGLDILQGRILPAEPVVVVIPPPVIKPDTIVVRDTVVVIKEVIAAPPPPPPVVVPEPVKEDVLFLTGNITDAETGDPIIAKVDVVNTSTNLVIATTASSDIDGSYRVMLPSRRMYIIEMRATGFLSEMKALNIPDTSKRVIFNLNGKLNKIKVGKKVVLNNILFESGKAVLTAGSYSEIDKLVGVLNDSPQMRIEISGHTDKTGSEPLNMKLSESRAKAVVDYLVGKGISQTRLEFRGYGSSQGIADNATPAGRAKNRRVEFKILEF